MLFRSSARRRFASFQTAAGPTKQPKVSQLNSQEQPKLSITPPFPLLPHTAADVPLPCPLQLCHDAAPYVQDECLQGTPLTPLPIALASRSAVQSLMRATHKTHCGCPVCSTVGHAPADIFAAANALRSGGRSKQAAGTRSYATPVDLAQQKEYAFEVSASNLRFGEGVTRVSGHRRETAGRKLIGDEQEVGMDFKNQGATKVGVYTDATVAKLLPMQMAIESLEMSGIPYEVYDKTRVEPNQVS